MTLILMLRHLWQGKFKSKENDCRQNGKAKPRRTYFHLRANMRKSVLNYKIGSNPDWDHLFRIVYGGIIFFLAVFSNLSKGDPTPECPERIADAVISCVKINHSPTAETWQDCRRSILLDSPIEECRQF